MLHPHHGVELRKYNNHRRRQPIKSVPNRSDRFEVIEDSRPALSQEVFPITRLSMRSSSATNLSMTSIGDENDSTWLFLSCDSIMIYYCDLPLI